MSAMNYEVSSIVADGLIDSPVATRDVDTPITGIYAVERMIIEYRSKRLVGEEVQPLAEFDLERSR